jgi:acetyl-CoA C-acetyltransferase
MTSVWPILISASQYTHQKTKDERLNPLKLMIKSAKEALNIPNVSKLKELIDAMYMVNINSWSYKDAPGELSEILGINPTEKTYLSDGGNTPQMLVNRAAKRIHKGVRKCILIVGGEASYSVYQSKKEKRDLSWPKKEEPDYMEGEIWHGTNKFENNYKLIIPPYSYALFETAYRETVGLSLQEHRMKMGKLFENFSEVAANNPYAWTQKSYSTKEIITPSPNNRNVCYPYTKRMCSNMFVDQSAAVLITSEDLAKKLEIPKKRWVYLRGASDFQNIFDITRRPKLATSPAARFGSEVALKQAGLMLDEIDLFDIYSCFPSIVEIISDEIGIKKDDTRDLTITGGLPFFGGPWSNYSLHAIATAVNIIQKDPEITIMIIANGGYNTKQSFGIYGTNPPLKGFDENDTKEIQSRILDKVLPEPVKKANGICKILGYTLIYNRDGTRKYGIALGAMENKRHTLANLKGTDEELAQLERNEIVGSTYRV